MATGKEKKDYIELRFPNLSSPYVALVIIIIILTAGLGFLTDKVNSLEKKVSLISSNAQLGSDTVTPPQIVDVEIGSLPINGDKNAPITIVEFSDFECPFCKAFFDDAYPEIKEKYIDTGKVKFSYRHFPLNSIHPNAQIAAEASECANEQNAFWEYHDLLFENQEDWAALTGNAVNTAFTRYASQVGGGLDQDKFLSCLDSNKYAQNVNDDLTAGSAVQVDGTPAFFVNGYRMVGAQPFSEFERIIEQELAK